MFPAREGDFEIGEGERPILGRHIVLAAHDEQEIEHVGIEDVPCADLLLDHVVARLFDVHGKSGFGESLG